MKRENNPPAKTEVDPSASFLRVEHHTLTCLPRTGTIVFAVRSYMTPLTQIRDEGSGPVLAEVCDSMPEKFGFYKNRPTWGQRVCAWLREGKLAFERQDLSKAPATISTVSCPFAQLRESDSTPSCPFAP